MPHIIDVTKGTKKVFFCFTPYPAIFQLSFLVYTLLLLPLSLPQLTPIAISSRTIPIQQLSRLIIPRKNHRESKNEKKVYVRRVAK